MSAGSLIESDKSSTECTTDLSIYSACNSSDYGTESLEKWSVVGKNSAGNPTSLVEY